MKPILTLARMATGIGALALALATGCSAGPGAAAGTGGRPTAVAAEDFWGSLLSQLAGDHVVVTSIVSDPAVDPHDYDARPSDAVAVAGARLVVVNGVGYDSWASKLVGANPRSGRVVIDVGRLVGARPGDNPHRWYVPADVHRAVDAMVTGLKRIDPAHAAAFDDAAARLRSGGLAAYDGAIARIRSAYAGRPIAVSESVFDGMAGALGLRVLTPQSFADAVAEGNEPTAGDKETVDHQLKGHQVSAFVYNSQNSTPDVRALQTVADRAGVPVVPVSETLSPRGATFTDWQAAQLVRLEKALAAAPQP